MKKRTLRRPRPRSQTEEGLSHQPVLLKEVLTHLAIKPSGIYVDATFGRGGHAREILRCLGPIGRLVVIDKDPLAVRAAASLEDDRVVVRAGSFTNLRAWMVEQGGCGKVDGLLLDLGVSSPQLDDPGRGFSFLREGPLDMRMDPNTPQTAADWVNSAREAELAEVLERYGEERFAKRMAAAIVRERRQAPILTTTRLAEVIAGANPRWERHKHPATRAFQAIRIFINRELEELEACLMQSVEVLAVGGRLLVISFHSLEDRLVKRFIERQAKEDVTVLRHLPVAGGFLPRLRRVTRAIKPGVEEITHNPRARSAVLRVAEKVR